MGEGEAENVGDEILAELRDLGTSARVLLLVRTLLERMDVLLRALQEQEAELDRLRGRVARLEAAAAAQRPPARGPMN